jgi:methyl-accepting chemotaxis protein
VTSEDFRPKFLTYHSSLITDLAGKAAQFVKVFFRQMNHAEKTIAGMDSIRAKVGLSAERVQEMGRRSEQIGTIVETIDDIARQTNLLALNAAIEAARAGDHGKGFAVVAEEVRKLAEKSAGATKEIAGLIKGIRQTITEAITAMNEGTAEVEAGVIWVGQAGQALQHILATSETVQRQTAQIAVAAEEMTSSAAGLSTAMDTVSAVVEENSAATEEMSANSGQVAEVIEEIASVSQENSAAAEQVSAATEEMNAQIDTVSQSAAALSRMARVLQELVDHFRLESQRESAAEAMPAEDLDPTAEEDGEPLPDLVGESEVGGGFYLKG